MPIPQAYRRTGSLLEKGFDVVHSADRLDALSVMARELAHDLNNLLGVAFNYVTLLQSRDDATSGEIAGIKAATEQAMDLVRRLQQFTGRVRTEPSSVDVSVAIAEAVASLDRDAESASRIVVEPVPTELRVDVDPLHLKAILIELLRNACDAVAREAGSQASVGVVETGDGHVEISVSDDGLGMDAQTLERCLEPFFTTKYRRIGTGLGLSVAHGLAQANDGRLSLISEPGRGTRVSVVIPRSQ